MFSKRGKPVQDTVHGQNEVSLDLVSELPNLFRLAADGNLNELKTFVSATGQTNASLAELDDNGATILHHAAAHNQTDVMQYLIECRADRDAVDNDGNTPLHLATTRGSVEAMHLLLHNRASDTILNKVLEAPLHIAVRINDPKLVQALVSHPQVEILQPGPNMNTPIHIAAMCDNIESFRVLCESSQIAEAIRRSEGYTISSRNSDGLTAIDVAARNGSHCVLELLIQTTQWLLGCSAEGKLEILDSENATPLYSSVDAGLTETVKILMKYGAIPTKSYGSRTPPLHLACAQGKLEMVQFMVEQFGRDILSVRDQYGRLPIFYGVISSHSASLIAFLNENGVSLDATEDDGCTPLHFAIKCGNLSSVKELLSRGANPLVRNSQGSNSAHFAVTFYRWKIVKILSTHEASSQLFTDKNNDGYSAILLALKMGHGDLVLPLLSSSELSQTVNDVDAKNNNCLHLAAASNDWRTLRVLLDIPASADCINKTNCKKETPLHLAAQGGEIRSVEILLSHGALVSKSFNYTALMCACFNGHSKCVLLLHKTHPFQRDWHDQNGNTALHHAALSGDADTLRTTLDIGCKITKNAEGLSFMDIIITAANEKCGLVVVNHARWQECLDFPSQSNPMIGFIQQLPSAARSVLDRCHECALLDKRHAEYWEKYDFKYLQPLKLPSKNEHQAVDKSANLLPEKENSEKNNSMTTLQKMVKCKRLDLLVHPVVEKYLTYKWNTYGAWMYLISFFLRLTVAIFLSAFILVVPNPNTIQPQSNITHNNMSFNGSNIEETSLRLSVSAQALRATALVINVLLSLVILMPLAATLRKLLTAENTPILVYILSILCTYVFLLAPNPIDIWTFGAVASFFSWLAVIMGLLFFKLFGIYVKMFLTVTITVFKVLFVSFYLILAFAFPFYILAGPLPPFASIGYSLFTLFSYMLGEVQYELIILEDQNGNLNHSPVIFLFVVVVAILMTIAMANLLVGLAVGDIEGIRSSALLERRKLHVLYLSHLEHSPLLQRFHKPFIISYPNRKASLLKRLWNYLRSIVAEEEAKEMKPASPAATMVNCDHTNCCQQEDIIRLGQQLEELTLLVKQFCEQQKGIK